MEVLDWIRAHWQTLAELAAAVWVIVSLVVALTPSEADDRFLAKLANRFSFLKPRDVAGLLSVPGVLEKPDGKGPPLGPVAILAFSVAGYAVQSGAL